jgi:cytoskeleton protein RodZ
MDPTITIAEDNNTIMNKPEPLKKTGLGERFKSARKAMQLTEKEAAARLHLNTTIIFLMENENFAGGPPTAFMRGYLRSYARLLNLPETEIASTLKNLENTISSNNAIAVIQTKPKKNNERYLRWLTYLIVLVLIVLVSVWWNSHSRYVIADVLPPPATTEVKSTSNISASETVTTATTTASTQLAAPLQKTPEPTALSATSSPTLSTATQSVNKPTLSSMKMALPEPDID